MELERIRLALSVDASQWASGLAAASTNLNSFATKSTGMLSKLDGLFSKAAGAAGAFGIALAVAFAASIGPAIAFEQAFTGVTKTVSGTTAQLDSVRTGILNLSKEMPSSAVAIAGVAEAAGQLGVSTDKLLGFTETMVMLGETTNLSAEEAATAIAQFSNIMGTSFDNADELGSVIVGLGNAMATTEADITNWGLRLAGAGKIAGLTEPQVLALGAAFSSVGIEAEAGGTAISTVLIDMIKAVDQGGPKLEAFAKTAGLTGQGFREMFDSNPTEALLLFIEGLARVEQEGGSAVQILDQLGLDGARLTRVLLSAAGAGDLVRVAVEQANVEWANGSALQNEYAKFAETTAARLEILKGRITAVAIAFGTPALGAVVAVLDGIGDGIGRLTEIFGPAASEIGELLGNIAKGFGGLAAVLASDAFVVAEPFLIGISGALQGVAGALNALGPAGLVIAVLAADIAFVGPISIVAASGLAAMGASATGAAVGLQASAASAGIMATAARGLTAALSASPLIIFAAGMYAIGRAAKDAKKEAEELADTVTNSFGAALESADYDNYINVLNRTRDRMAGLSDTVHGTGSAFDSFRYYAQGAFEIFTPNTENTMLNSAVAFGALGDAITEAQAAAVEFNVPRLAEGLGVTADEVLRMAMATGTLEQVMSDSGTVVTDLLPIYRALMEETAALAEEVEASGDAWAGFVELMDSGSGTFADVAGQLGVTTSALEYLAEVADVDAEGLLKDGNWRALLTAVAPLADAYEEAAAGIGMTTDELIAGVQAVDRMASSYDNLQSSVDGAVSALANLDGQQRNVAEATTVWDEALKTVSKDGSLENLEAAAGAMRQLSADYAASGVSAGEAAAKQQELYAQLQTVGQAAGFSKEQIAEVAVALGLIPEETIAELTVEGEAAKVEADAVRARLEELAGVTWVTKLVSEWDDKQMRAAVRAAEDFDGTEASAEATFEVFGVDNVIDALAIVAQLQDRTVVIEFAVGGSAVANKSGSTLNYKGLNFEPGFAAGGLNWYAAGDVANGHHPEITRSTGPVRVWSEPETQGEGYVPLANDWRRPRAKAITREIARRLGMGRHDFAAGGIVSNFAAGGMFSTSVALPTIAISVKVDAEALGQIGIDLGPVNRSLLEIGRSFDTVTAASSTMGSRVGSVFDGMGTQAQTAGRAMLASLSPDQFLAAFSRISGWARGSFVEWLGAWDGTVESAVAKLDEAGLEMRHIFAAMFAQGGASAEVMFDTFTEAGIEMTAAAQEAGLGMLAALSPDKFLDTFSRLSGWARDAFTEWLGEWDGSVAEALDRLDEAGLDIGYILEAAFREGATQAEVLDLAIESVSDSLDDVRDAARRADDSLDILMGRSRDVVDAQLDYLDAVERVNNAISEGEAFGFSDGDARKNLDSLLRAGDAMREYAIAVASSGVSAAEAANVFAGLREQFRRMARDAGLPQSEVDRLTELLFAIPTTVLTQITLDAQVANDEADAFRESMEALDALTAEATILANITAAEDRIRVINDLLAVVDDTQVAAALDAEKELLEAAIADAHEQLRVLDGTVASPTVRVDDQATGTLGLINRMILSIPKDTESRVRVVTTNEVVNVAGGTLLPGDVRTFAHGGLENHTAQIAPAGAWRVWAEPETGGEAYIPLAPWKRARSLAVLAETARIMGHTITPYSTGGINGRFFGTATGPTTVHAPIQISVTASPGMDEGRVAELVGARVRAELGDVSRDLMNMR